MYLFKNNGNDGIYFKEKIFILLFIWYRNRNTFVKNIFYSKIEIFFLFSNFIIVSYIK